MKQVKISKSLLKKHPADILLAFGVTKINICYPQHVYFSGEDYKILRKNLRAKAKKEYPGATAKIITSAVEMELLNFGPNESLAKAIRPGYALIDTDSIEAAQKE